MTAKIKFLNAEEKAFYCGLLKRTFVFIGLTYFSISVSLSSWNLITPSLLGGGLYLFSELAKYHGIDINKKVLNKDKNKYSFII